MFNKFKNLSPKYKVLLVAGVGAAIALFYIFSSVQPNTQPNIPGSSTSIPTQAPFELINIYPRGDQVITFPNTAVAFTFNAIVDDKLVTANIEPTLGHKIYSSRDKKTIFVAPLKSWEFNVAYKITLIGLPITAETTFTPKNPNTAPEVFDETFHED